MIYHSPTEPRSITGLLRHVAAPCAIEVESSSMPEKRGVDFLWRGNHQWWGVQRKELNDFLRSLDDGRLAVEIAQMTNSVTMPMLVLEGKFRYANEMLITNGWGGTVTRSGMNKRLLTIQSKGVTVFHADEKMQTVGFIIDAYLWSQSATHETASTRPKPAPWGKATNHDFQVHMLTSLPGIGRKTAEQILRTLGRCPLRMETTVEELAAVPGIGRKTAAKLIKALEQPA